VKGILRWRDHHTRLVGVNAFASTNHNFCLRVTGESPDDRVEGAGDKLVIGTEPTPDIPRRECQALIQTIGLPFVLFSNEVSDP